MNFFTPTKKTVIGTTIVFLLIANLFTALAQCPVTAYANATSIFCGDTVKLGALASGCQPLNNNFNSGAIGSWQASPGGVVTNGTGAYACAGPPPEGTNYLWMGATVAAPRGVTTTNYDLTQCGATSGTLCFTMKYSTQAGPDPCEGIDLPAEGISVQYSTSGPGGPWITLQYYDPNGGYDPILTSWNRYCLIIPAGAFTTSTCFRWYQSQSSGAGFDTWGLDNMVITLNGPGYTYDWAHDAQGPTASSFTPPVAPTATTTYTVTYTNGGVPCTSSVTINVSAPTAGATASPTTICSGGSSQLTATSSIAYSPPTSCGISANAACPPFSSADEKTVGAAATAYDDTDDSPFSEFGSSYGRTTSILYRKADLAAAGLVAGKITSLAFDVARIYDGFTDYTSTVYANMKISMGCAGTSATQTMVNFGNPAVALSTVFNPKSKTMVLGRNYFFFDKGYDWDGLSNIVVEICWKEGSFKDVFALTKYSSPGYNCMYTYSLFSSEALCFEDNSFGNLYNDRPNTTFGFCKPKNIALTYSWSPTTGLSNPNIANPVASPGSTTTYTVTVTETGAPAACAATAPVTVTLSTVGTLSAVNGSRCGTGTVALSVGGACAGGTINWYNVASGGASIGTGVNFTTPSISTTTTYYASCKIGACEGGRIPVVATVTQPSVATFSYTGTPYCQNAANPSPTFSGGGVAGTFSSTAGLVFVSTATGQVNLSASTAGTYTVTNTIAAGGGCPAVTATSTITITALPVATFSYTGTPYCKNAANPSPTFSGGGVAGTFSSTAGLVFVSTATGQVNLSASTAGTYTVTNTVAAANGCPVVTATSTITITPLPVATFSYTGTPYCQNAANPSPTFSGGGVAGTFSSTAGLVFVSTATGQVNLSASTAGTYTVTNTIAAASGCPAVTATSSITITALPVATFSYTGTPYCKNAANPSPTFSGGGVAGTFSSTAGLVFVSTATGQVNLAASTAGTYTVTNTIAAASGCPAVTATATITITPLPVATFSYTGTPYCQNAANPSPTFSGGGVAGTFSSTAGLVFVSTATGQVNLSASTAGTYTVTNTIAAASGCPAVTATSTITINPVQSAAFNYSTATYCQTGADPTPTITGTAGGVFSSSPAGLVFISTATGQIDVSASALNTYTITYTTAGPCGASSTASVTISTAPSAAFSYTGTPYCQNAANPFPTFGAGASAGTFSSTAGLVFVSTATGQVNLSASTAGTYTVTNTIPAAGGCAAASATSTIKITALPVATFSYTGTPYCKNAANPSPTFSGGGVAGTFSSTAGLVFVSTATGQVNLSASTAGTYTVTNTVAAANGCPVVTATSTITITPLPVATFSYTGTPYCQNAANPSPTFSGGGVAGTFSSTAGLVFVSTATGQVNLSASTAGTYTVTNTIAAASGCPAVTATSSITITALPVATFSYTGTPYCKNAANPSPTFSGGGVAGTFSSTAGLVFVSTATGQVNLSASTAGTYTVTNTVAAANGCPVVTSTSTITITPLPVATFSYTGTPYCQNAANPSPTFSGGGVAGTFSSTAGLVFVSTSTGEVNLAASTAGTYTVTNTIAAASGCPAVTATSTITINPVQSAAFNYSTATYCQTGADPTPTITGTAGGVFSSSPAGLVFISTATGQIDVSASALNTYTITYTTAGPCGASSTASVTISTAPSAAFSYSGPYCQGGSPNPTSTLGVGASNGIYSSTPGLIFVNTSTGEIDLAASTPGTYTVTNNIAAAGGCSATSATNTVTIDPAPTATAGSDASICAGDTYILSGSIGGGASSLTWSSPTGGTFDDATLATATYTPSAIDISNGSVVLTITSNDPAGPCGVVTDAMTLTINQPATASAGSDASICAGSTYLLSGSIGGSASTLTWSSTTGGTFDNANIGGATYTPSAADIAAGSVTLTISTDDPTGPCSLATDVMVLTITPMEDASFSYSGTIFCQTGTNQSPTITGTPGGTFSSTPGLTLDPSTGLVTVSTSTIGTYSITYTTAGTCFSSSSVTVTITTAPSAAFSYAGPYCQTGGIDPLPTLGIGASAGTFSSTTGLTIDPVTGQITSGTSTPGTYTVTNSVAASGGCAATSSTAIVVIDQPATASAGTDAAVCAGDTYTLSGSTGGSASSLTWTTSGSGTFNNSTSPTSIYTPSAADITAGSVTITITTDDPAGACGAVSDQMILSINALPNVNAGADTTLTCAATSLVLNASSSSASANYSWSGPGIVSGTNTANPVVNTIGTYNVSITDLNGCISTDQLIVSINTTPPNANAGSDTTLTCAITSVALNGSSLTSGVTFSWSGAGITSGGNTSTPTVNAIGNYTVTVTDPSNGCTASDIAVVNSNTTPPSANAGVDAIFPCSSTSLLLNGSSTTSGAQYSWSGPGIATGSNTATPTISTSGTYTVTVTDPANGCTFTDIVLITDQPAPVASFSNNPTTGTPPLTVDFTNTSQNANTYSWTFGDGNSSSLSDPVDIYTSPGTYNVVLVASDNLLCPSSATATIIVFENFSLIIPNIFTPNGDGNNDVFKVTATGVVEFHAEIFDRWGLKLSTSDNINDGWDGKTQNGAVASDGTYFYIITVKAADNKDHVYKGAVTLVR